MSCADPARLCTISFLKRERAGRDEVRLDTIDMAACFCSPTCSWRKAAVSGMRCSPRLFWTRAETSLSAAGAEIPALSSALCTAAFCVRTCRCHSALYALLFSVLHDIVEGGSLEIGAAAPKAATKAEASEGWGEGLSAAAPGGGALAQAALKAACISANATPLSLCVLC